MNLKNYYWYFDSELSDKICDDIIEYDKSTRKKKELKIILGTYGSQEKYQDLKDKETLMFVG